MELKNEEDRDYIYLAGLFDGEGTFDLGLHGTNYKLKSGKMRQSIGCSPRMCMSLGKRPINEKVIYWLKERFGGSTSIRGRDFQWQLSGDNLRMVIRRIIPYLKIKDEEAKILLEVLNIIDKKGGRGFRWNYEFAKQIANLQDRMFQVRPENKGQRKWFGEKILRIFINNEESRSIS